MLWQMAEEFVLAEVPVEVVEGIRLGQKTALRKPTGVVGDTFRWAVSRAVAQQIAASVERATAPFQCVLSTRSGTECVGHAIQALTDLPFRQHRLVSVERGDALGSAQHGGRGRTPSFCGPILRATFSLHLGGR